MLAFGQSSTFVVRELSPTVMDDFQTWIDSHKSWVFGCISYDFGEVTTKVTGENRDLLKLPYLAFFEPKFVFNKVDDNWTQVLGSPVSPFDDKSLERILSQNGNSTSIHLHPLLNKEEYKEGFEGIQKHIHLGDIYEMNFCQGFVGEAKNFDSYSAYQKLNQLTQAPFSAYFKMDEGHLMCGSPERFLRRRGAKIISQPIKGTRPRSHDFEEDSRLRDELANSEKDKIENVMITDLVRNDLSRIANKASVRVDELFGIHSFNTVHQMISTVSCEVNDSVQFTDILRATFPMGSMTGAPKVSALNLINKFENFGRGWYSGSVGYIEANGNFDFNVIIRSLIYNSNTQILGAFAGGAIVDDSEAEGEYQESMLKAAALFKAIKS